jgi:CSLREA domain-containing protein
VETTKMFEDRESPVPAGAASGAGARRRRRRRVVTALGMCVLALATSAGAATFVVNSTADTTDGSCDVAGGGCTLREAIEAAVATPGRDTINFDPTVFPHGPTPVPIVLASELPMIADPAGTVIDGAGASVRVAGSGAIADGLVFASAPGVPLANVTLANVSVDFFEHGAVVICGGVPPSCDGDLSGVVVRNVLVNLSGDAGISIGGAVVKQVLVADSVVFQSGADGIMIFGSQSLTGARVERCTASRSGADGIVLAAPQQTGSAVIDSFALKSGSEGIRVVSAGDVAKPKLANVVAFIGHDGILLDGGRVVAPSITDAVVSGNDEAGIVIASSGGTSGLAMASVTADANGFGGITLDGPPMGTSGEISNARIFRHDAAGIGATGADGLRVHDVLTAENTTGVFLSAANSSVQRVHASSNVSGIIVADGAGNTVTQSAASANASGGIAIEQGSGANVIKQNLALGNSLDLDDENPDCDANSWTDDVFTTRSRSCIH